MSEGTALFPLLRLLPVFVQVLRLSFLSPFFDCLFAPAKHSPPPGEHWWNLLKQKETQQGRVRKDFWGDRWHQRPRHEMRCNRHGVQAVIASGGAKTRRACPEGGHDLSGCPCA